MNKLKWELVDSVTARIRVKDGWIVNHITSYSNIYLKFINIPHTSASTFFLYDPLHLWEPEE